MPLPDCFALVADIHGNIWALEAVLDDLARRGIPEIVNLGDSLDGPLDPNQTAACLLALGNRLLVSLRGNGERLFLPGSGDARNEKLFHGLPSPARAWLKTLPAVCRLGELFCCHGTPDSDDTYLLDVVEATGRVRLVAGTSLLEGLRHVPGKIIACAHSHLPRSIRLPGGRLVVNPGSVGLAAYTGNLPYPHAMETGSPHARYAILTRRRSEWQAELVAVEYPWQQAAQAARQNGREDWASWIETGRA